MAAILVVVVLLEVPPSGAPVSHRLLGVLHSGSLLPRVLLSQEALAPPLVWPPLQVSGVLAVDPPPVASVAPVASEDPSQGPLPSPSA